MAEALNQPKKRETVGKSAREAVLGQYMLEKELQANFFKSMQVLELKNELSA